MQGRRQKAEARLKAAEKDDKRFQHELKEMQETHDLDQVDDDVENVATLYEWRALEHEHRPKSAKWFVVLAVAVTILVAIFLLLANFLGAITTALAGILLYVIAQKPAAEVRYRIMVDGLALDNVLYHFRDLEKFNVIYEPDESKTMIIKSKRPLAPLLHMEIGNADPVIIRDILLEFLPEDQDMEEPLVDIVARRLGF